MIARHGEYKQWVLRKGVAHDVFFVCPCSRDPWLVAPLTPTTMSSEAISPTITLPLKAQDLRGIQHCPQAAITDNRLSELGEYVDHQVETLVTRVDENDASIETMFKIVTQTAANDVSLFRTIESSHDNMLIALD